MTRAYDNNGRCPRHKFVFGIFHPSIHRSMDSAPVGAQCPLTFSLGECLGYRDWLCYPGLSPVLVSIALPFALHISVFYSLFFTCHRISFVYFLRWRYLHPTTNPPPYSRLGTGTMVNGCRKRLRYHRSGVWHNYYNFKKLQL